MRFDSGLVDGEAGGNGCGVQQWLRQAPHDARAARPRDQYLSNTELCISVRWPGQNTAIIVLLCLGFGSCVVDDSPETSKAKCTVPLSTYACKIQ